MSSVCEEYRYGQKVNFHIVVGAASITFHVEDCGTLTLEDDSMSSEDFYVSFGSTFRLNFYDEFEYGTAVWHKIGISSKGAKGPSNTPSPLVSVASWFVLVQGTLMMLSMLSFHYSSSRAEILELTKKLINRTYEEVYEKGEEVPPGAPAPLFPAERAPASGEATGEAGRE